MTLAFLILLCLGAIYLGACRIWPWRSCGGCEGGRIFAPDRKAWRDHGSCHGSGKRRRFGAIILDGLRRD
jgi:hypothetical protein